MIPHLAGHLRLQELRELYLALKPVRLAASLAFLHPVPDRFCPEICRPAAALACLVAGEAVPRPARLAQVFRHILEAWPGPVTARSLAEVLGIRYSGEALKILRPMAQAGLLRAVRGRPQIRYYFDEIPLQARSFQEVPRDFLSLACRSREYSHNSERTRSNSMFSE